MRQLVRTPTPNKKSSQIMGLRPPFGRNSNVKFLSPIQPPLFGRLEWTHGVENGTNRNLGPTFLFDVYIHYWLVLHRLATIHNAADREKTQKNGLESINEIIGDLAVNWGHLNTPVMQLMPEGSPLREATDGQTDAFINLRSSDLSRRSSVGQKRQVGRQTVETGETPRTHSDMRYLHDTLKTRFDNGKNPDTFPISIKSIALAATVLAVISRV